LIVLPARREGGRREREERGESGREKRAGEHVSLSEDGRWRIGLFTIRKK
jgi:hypothetical protein